MIVSHAFPINNSTDEELPKVVEENFPTYYKKTDEKMRTIQEIESAPLIDLSKPKELAHGMKTFRIQSDGPFCFKISATIPFTPSCFQGNGDEERKGIVLSISQEDYDKLSEFSESFKTQLIELYPDINKSWNNCMKPATEKYPSQLKAKINVKGDRACKFYNPQGLTIEAPSNWGRLEVTAIVRLGGIYVQSKTRGAGMTLDVTHVQYDPHAQREENPFA